MIHVLGFFWLSVPPRQLISSLCLHAVGVNVRTHSQVTSLSELADVLSSYQPNDARRTLLLQSELELSGLGFALYESLSPLDWHAQPSREEGHSDNDVC